jgi:uncharacterized protein (DUF58 family)
VREREWEASQSIWLWIDRSASMAFASDSRDGAEDRARAGAGLALADIFVQGGERVGLLGLMPARATRDIAEKVAQALAADPTRSTTTCRRARRSAASTSRADRRLPVADREITAVVEAISGRGGRGHLVMVVDPIEETFPFSGQAVLHEPEIGLELRVGDAGAWGGAYRDRIKLHREALADLTRGRGWTLTIHRTDRPASEAALRLMTLAAASRGTAFTPPDWGVNGCSGSPSPLRPRSSSPPSPPCR